MNNRKKELGAILMMHNEFLSPIDFFGVLATGGHPIGRHTGAFGKALAREFIQEGRFSELQLKEAWRLHGVVLRRLRCSARPYSEVWMDGFCAQAVKVVPIPGSPGTPMSPLLDAFLFLSLMMAMGMTGDEELLFSEDGPREDHRRRFFSMLASWMNYCTALLGVNVRQVPQFFVTEALVGVFSQTSVRVPGSDIRLPFDCCLVHLPVGLWMLDDCVSASRLVIRGLDSEGGGAVSGTGIIGECSVPHCASIPCSDKPVNVMLDALFSSPEYSSTRLRPIFEFVANFALYVTNRQEDVIPKLAERVERLEKRAVKHPEGSRKRRKIDRQVERLRDTPIYIVGRKYEKAAKRNGCSLTMMARHVVRGHWRNQAWGPGRQLRRQVFIEPHFRGGILKEIEDDDLSLEKAARNYYVTP